MIIAQISDPHLSIQPDRQADRQADHGVAGGGELGGEEALRRAVAHLNALPAPPDVVLVTGDCADHGDAAEYERVRAVLGGLRAPAYVIPGNHDHRERMLAAFGPQGAWPLDGFAQYVVEGWPVRLIALDTHVMGRDEGRLGAAQLGWLEARLAERPEQPALLFMHHPPFRTGLMVFDEIGLMDAEALGGVVARHPRVEAVVAGHVHAVMTRRFHGTVAMTCASTQHQLLPDVRREVGLAAVLEPPVCLIHVWHEDAGLVSYASTITGKRPPMTTLHDGERWV